MFGSNACIGLWVHVLRAIGNTPNYPNFSCEHFTFPQIFRLRAVLHCNFWCLKRYPQIFLTSKAAVCWGGIIPCRLGDLSGWERPGSEHQVMPSKASNGTYDIWIEMCKMIPKPVWRNRQDRNHLAKDFWPNFSISGRVRGRGTSLPPQWLLWEPLYAAGWRCVHHRWRSFQILFMSEWGRDVIDTVK